MTNFRSLSEMRSLYVPTARKVGEITMMKNMKT